MRLLALGLILQFALASDASARTWYVKLDGTGDAPNIQAAIDSAQTYQDDVLVAAGTYLEIVNFNGKTIAVRSESGAEDTIIDATGLGRAAVTFAGGESYGAELRGFTVTGGLSGILCLSDVPSSPSISRCIITGNRWGVGGGISFECTAPPAEHRPTISNCSITNNVAESSGGGISCIYTAPLITGCLISENTAQYAGAGVYLIWSESRSVLSHCVITGNRIVGGMVGGGGGGVHTWGNPGSLTTLTSCRISGNTGEWHGGGVSHNAPMEILGCTISGNLVNGSGGAIYSSSYLNASRLLLANSTVAGNRATVSGGGLSSDGDSTSGRITVDGSILWGNCAPVGPEIDNGGRVTLGCSTVDPSGVSGAAHFLAGNVLTNPLFCSPMPCAAAPTTAGGYTLQASSPCLNAPGCGLIGALGEGCGVAGVGEGIDTTSPVKPLAIWPNPFRSVNTIEFNLESPALTELLIFDVSGRLVRSFGSEKLPAGVVRYHWDGRDDGGRLAAAGTYFAQLRAGQVVRGRKLVFIR